MSTFREWFRNFFRDREPARVPASTSIETAPLSEEQLQSVSQAEPPRIQPAQLLVGIGQSVGMQREHNEDTLFVMQSVFADGGETVPFGIFIVADGMGGHLNGEVASAFAARTLGEYLVSKVFLPFAGGHASEGRSIHEMMGEGVEQAHRAVVRNAPGGGTTLTAALVIGDQVTLTHVGDSRAYIVHANGQMQVATQDHTLVRRLQELGQIDEREASIHPQRNVLYRALGQPEPFVPDIQTHTLPENSALLLCSDGLWSPVEDHLMREIILGESNLTLACHKLVEAANAAGGPDNISAILVRYAH